MQSMFAEQAARERGAHSAVVIARTQKCRKNIQAENIRLSARRHPKQAHSILFSIARSEFICGETVIYLFLFLFGSYQADRCTFRTRINPSSEALALIVSITRSRAICMFFLSPCATCQPHRFFTVGAPSHLQINCCIFFLFARN